MGENTRSGSDNPNWRGGRVVTTRLEYLDRIAAGLEGKILAGRGDVAAMRREWRECQNEMIEIEATEAKC